MTEEQDALRHAVRSLLANHPDVRSAIAEPQGHNRELWGALTQMGVAALAIPERYGGLGAGLAETQVVLAELGRTLTPAPLLSSTYATQLLLALGEDTVCARLLPRIADGAVAAVAELDPDGTARYVLDGDEAEILLVSDGHSVFEIDPAAAERRWTPAMDPTRRLASVTPNDAVRRELGPATAVEPARDRAAVALTAEQVGAAERMLELTVEYAKVRVQFGRPIGSFQAIKHRLADLHVLVETARSASRAAAEGTITASVAKAYVSDAFSAVAAEGIQLHGGIAITWEHDAQLYFKRAHGSAQLFGSPDRHRRRLEEVLLGC